MPLDIYRSISYTTPDKLNHVYRYLPSASFCYALIAMHGEHTTCYFITARAARRYATSKGYVCQYVVGKVENFYG